MRVNKWVQVIVVRVDGRTRGTNVESSGWPSRSSGPPARRTCAGSALDRHERALFANGATPAAPRGGRLEGMACVTGDGLRGAGSRAVGRSHDIVAEQGGRREAAELRQTVEHAERDQHREHAGARECERLAQRVDDVGPKS